MALRMADVVSSEMGGGGPEGDPVGLPAPGCQCLHLYLRFTETTHWGCVKLRLEPSRDEEAFSKSEGAPQRGF